MSEFISIIYLFFPEYSKGHTYRPPTAAHKRFLNNKK